MKTLLLRLDDHLDRQLIQVCRQEGYQKTGIIRKLIRDFVASHSAALDPVLEAAAFGIDMTRLQDNLQKTPTERLKNHEQAASFAVKLRSAGSRSKNDPI